MERVNSTSTIIEFNGLPGIGKTTLANELIKQLRESGCVCYKSFYRYDYQRRFLDFTILLSLKRLYLAFRLILCSCYLGNIVERLQSINTVLRYIRMYQQFRRKRKNGEFLIVDQGIVQGLLSLFHKDEISRKEQLLSIIQQICNSTSFVVVNCLNLTDLASQRIVERKKSGGRLDVMKDDERDETLRLQGINC